MVASIDAGRPILVYAPRWDVGLIYGYADDGRTVLVRHYESRSMPDRMQLADVNSIIAWLGDGAAVPLPRRDATRCWRG